MTSPEAWTLEPWRLFLVLAGPFVGTLAATWAVAWPRLPRPLAGGSRCARCWTPVPLWRQIPLLSWALAKGGRGCCDGRIPWSYPLGEAAGLAVGLISGLLAADWVEGTLQFLLGATLVYASVVDLRRYVIPVQAIAVVAALGVAGHVAARDWAGLGDSTMAAVVTAAALEGLRRLSMRSAGAGGLGIGDLALATALAIWLGRTAALMLAMAAGATLLLQMALHQRGALSFAPTLSGATLALLSASSTLNLTAA